MGELSYKSIALLVHIIKTLDSYQTCIKNKTINDVVISEMDGTLDVLNKLLPYYEKELRRYN